jgi:peptidoglycan/xylan/chitin deacetylase (PgdA/CDA1 family)
VRRLLNQSIEYLTKATGKRPVGYRAPSWQFSFWTMQQLKEEGFLYDSSLMASDDGYEILLDGQPTGVIELPIERILDDFPYFGGGANGSDPSLRVRGFPIRIRRRARRERSLSPDDAPAHHGTSRARRPSRSSHSAHESEGRRLVWTHEQVARHLKSLF